MTWKQWYWAILLIVCAACEPPKAVVLHPAPAATSQAPLRDRYALLVIIDGGRLTEIEALIEEKKLPTIERLFFQQGAVFDRATTIYPTLSIPGHQAIMTGLFPGTNGTPDLTWLDRANRTPVDHLALNGYLRANSDLINRNALYSDTPWTDTPHTLFTALGSAPTLASYEIIFHGATIAHPHHIVSTLWNPVVAKRPEYMDLDALETALSHWQARAEPPRLTAIACYGVDDLSHEVTSGGERVLSLYEAIDRALAEFEALARERGVLERMTWIITADHGQHLTAHQTLDLVTLFRDWGFRIEDDSVLRNRDVHIASRSVTNAQVYLRDDNSWTKPPRFDELISRPLPRDPTRTLIQSLRRSQGVKFLVLKKNAATIRLMSADSDADIVSLRYGDSDWLAYRPLQPERDPLGYLTEPSMRGRWTPGKFYSSDDWQTLTQDSAHPDVVQALAQLLASPDTGDITVVADPTTTIRGVKASNHGSFEREDMLVPLLMSGPDIRPGRYGTARVVDIYPTLLALFGISEDPALYDGRVLNNVLSIRTTPPIEVNHTALAALEFAFIEQPPMPETNRSLLPTLVSETERLHRHLARIAAVRATVNRSHPTDALGKGKHKRLLYLLEHEEKIIDERLARFEKMRQYLRGYDVSSVD